MAIIKNPLTIVQQGGVSPSTQSQSIFTGWTMPLTYLNSTDNVFVYESATHNITLTGLDSVGAISGNGTKKVTLTMNVSGTSNTQTPFTITCVNGNETLTYNGLAFYYGSELADGNCLAVAQTLTGTPLDIGYVFIESASLPVFSGDTTLWNNVYAYQIMTFIFGKWNGTSIGSTFLSGCISFNQPLVIPSTVTSIGSTFLNGCYSFNQPLTIPSGVTVIYSSFLNNCSSFNQPLVIPSTVTSIDNYFLNSCISFNQPLVIPSTITSIDNYFLNNCSSFNQPLVIPSTITSIGSTFLSSCHSFNQPLVIPSTITSIGNNVLYNCYSLTNVEYNASVYPTDNTSFAQGVNNKPSSTGTGILITGTHASDLKASLPDRTESPYRKLVLQE